MSNQPASPSASSDSNTPPSRHWVIVPAAGVGKRMRASCPKQYLPLNHQTIIEQTIAILLQQPLFNGVWVGISAGDAYWSGLACADDPRVHTFNGGEERSDTVYQGLLALQDLASSDDWVWVHDAARPCLSGAEVDALSAGLEGRQGALLAVKVNDTVKRANASGNVASTVDRQRLWRAMTPQVFRYHDLKMALEHCFSEGIVVTDDASALEQIGIAPRLVEGLDSNIKVTRPEDLIRAQQYYQEQNLRMPRIGSGYDVHAFEAGEFVTIGGVRIPHTQALKAHSDGDVLLHALADALLGALALGDIGKHFPDTDEKWCGADSRALLRGVFELVQAQGYRVGNVDVTIIAQAPKMAPHVETIQANIAADLSIEAHCVGVKATTTEGLGFTGRKEGIAAQASVLLVPAKTIDPDVS